MSPEERADLAAAEAYERLINRMAFAAYCADRDNGDPVRVPSYYRHLAEQELTRIQSREVATA